MSIAREEWTIDISMTFLQEDVEKVERIYADHVGSSLVRSRQWAEAVLTVTIVGEWTKFGAARPLLEATSIALEPLEAFEREFYGPWPKRMTVTADRL